MGPQHKDFSKRLQDAMHKQGWNQSELARRADIGRDNVSGYVRGRNMPNSKHLEKLARALNVPPSYLLGAAYGERNPVMADADVPIFRMEQLPDRPDYVRLSLRQELPSNIAEQIWELLRKARENGTK